MYGKMTIQTKKLISNLKKEIEKRKKKYSWNRKGMTSLEKAQIRKEIKLKQVQLQFAEDLIEARIKDIEQDKVIPNFVKAHLKIKLKELEKECQKYQN